MDILAYLMAKKGHNTAAIDLPSYLLGKGATPTERIEGTGTDISLSPTKKGKLDITFKGNVFQQTYSGKNLWRPNQTFPMSEYSNQYLYYDEETQVYTLNGTYTTTFFNIFLGEYANFNVGDNVLIRIEKISGTASANLEVGGYHQETGNNAWIGHTILRPNQDYAVSVGQVTKVPMTKAMIWISTANTVFDNFKFRILFAKSNDTTLKWEPFVGGQPAPNPSYPQNIQVVTGNNTVTVSNGDSQSQSYPLNLGSLELAKIGDYQDYIEGTPDNWVKKEVIGKVILDGSETWYKANENINSWVNNLANSHGIDRKYTNSRDDFVCNYFSFLGDAQNENLGNAMSFNISNAYKNSLYIQIDTNIASSNAQLKNWLSTHNAIIYYVKETSTDMPITDTTLISQLNALYYARSYDGTTNITSTHETDNMPMIFTASALKG